MPSSILIMYWHGLGDLLCLTPQLRHLSAHGFEVDLLVRPQVLKSRLLADCPYVRELIPLPFTEGGPSEGGPAGALKRRNCNVLYERLASEYDKAIKITSLHRSMRYPGGKIERNSRAIFSPDVVPISPPSDLQLEVFIPQAAERAAKRFISRKYPKGFIFQHTDPEYHPAHRWRARGWMQKNLPPLPIFRANASLWPDINVTFVVAREATHRVLSSSVFVHACDAMNAVMDVVHQGKPAPHGLPIESAKVKLLHGKYE